MTEVRCLSLRAQSRGEKCEEWFWRIKWEVGSIANLKDPRRPVCLEFSE